MFIHRVSKYETHMYICIYIWAIASEWHASFYQFLSCSQIYMVVRVWASLDSSPLGSIFLLGFVFLVGFALLLCTDLPWPLTDFHGHRWPSSAASDLIDILRASPTFVRSSLNLPRLHSAKEKNDLEWHSIPKTKPSLKPESWVKVLGPHFFHNLESPKGRI